MENRMNITLAKYIAWEGVNDSVNATIDGVDMSVPLDTNNRHYVEILKQVDEGTITIAEAD
jgi:hypothetical protein